jgi:hypothetical protein
VSGAREPIVVIFIVVAAIVMPVAACRDDAIALEEKAPEWAVVAKELIEILDSDCVERVRCGSKYWDEGKMYP